MVNASPHVRHRGLVSWDVVCGDRAMGGVTDAMDIARDHLLAAMRELGVGAKGVVRLVDLGWLGGGYDYEEPLITFFRRGENEMIMGGVDPDGP